MGQLVFQATLGGQVNLVGPNTASTFNINVPAVAGNMVTTGDTGTVSSTMLASSLSLTTPNINVATATTINGITVGKGAGSVATNTAVGASALAANTTGNENVAIGYIAMAANTTGADNVGIGRAAFNTNTTGNNTVAVGVNAMVNNTTGSSNVAVGMQALNGNTTASFSTAVGYQAGYSQTTGGENTLVGRQAGYSVTTGYGNTFIGPGNANSSAAGYAVTTGNYNTIVGGFTGNQGGLDIRTASNYIVLSDGQGNVREAIPSSGSREHYVGAALQQGQGELLWSNQSSISQNLATLFPDISFTSKGISVFIQVYTEASGSTGTSAMVNGARNSNGTWAFTTFSSVTAGGSTVTGSGSGTTITLTFGAGGQYGIASISVVTR
jgi:hypothetical protein